MDLLTCSTTDTDILWAHLGLRLLINAFNYKNIIDLCHRDLYCDLSLNTVEISYTRPHVRLIGNTRKC